MDNQFDVTLEDADLLSEVELTMNLIIAVREFERHLTDDEIDQFLHIVPPSLRRGARHGQEPDRGFAAEN